MTKKGKKSRNMAQQRQALKANVEIDAGLATRSGLARRGEGLKQRYGQGRNVR